MSFSPVTSVRFGHAPQTAAVNAASAQPAQPALSPLPADTVTLRFAGDHKPTDVVQANIILADVAAAFKEDPDVLYPKGFRIETFVNKGFYNNNYTDFFPGSIRNGSEYRKEGFGLKSLSHSLQLWVQQAARIDRENLMEERDTKVVPFDTVYEMQVAMPDGRKVRVRETVVLDEEAVKRAEAGERLSNGEGIKGRELQIEVRKGKDELSNIVITEPHHIDDISRNVEKILHSYITWKPDLESREKVAARMDGIIGEAIEQQSECLDCVARWENALGS